MAGRTDKNSDRQAQHMVKLLAGGNCSWLSCPASPTALVRMRGKNAGQYVEHVEHVEHVDRPTDSLLALSPHDPTKAVPNETPIEHSGEGSHM